SSRKGSHDPNWESDSPLYSGTAPGTRLANSGTCCPTPAAEDPRSDQSYHDPRARAGTIEGAAMLNRFLGSSPAFENELAKNIRHEGIRVGEIIGYRAWSVIESNWMRRSDDRLHSVFMRHYVWDPVQPASGDVREHGVYSFKEAIQSRKHYGHSGVDGTLLFGSLKIWAEIVEHEVGYRSEFAKIVSLNDGEPRLLEMFRAIYGLNICAPSSPG